MSGSYQIPARRGPVTRVVLGIDSFMSWMLYGRETWLVALLKGVPLFLFLYFVLFYIPNYVYYAVTLYVFQFSKDVGFLVSNGVGATTFVVLIILAVWTQAARGRTGFGWSLIRFLDFGQYLLTVFILIPWMVFNLAGGSLVPYVPPTLMALGLGALAAAIGAGAVVYLFLEYRRITRADAETAALASQALSPGS